ncbi:hypothetical protein ACC671_22135 [Rhizobium ruizarguesonis]|uniref:hypothetical protein n=1 Tax=Rhizobium leguminosarum TaxID=384 RepID=UPI001C8FAE25|nr:hypothetical protein [Rhizobium leguminosarum]MBY3043183.1 DUF1682 domain-containing protein [Rhizobium leguminosarum]
MFASFGRSILMLGISFALVGTVPAKADGDGWTWATGPQGPFQKMKVPSSPVEVWVPSKWRTTTPPDLPTGPAPSPIEIDGAISYVGALINIWGESKARDFAMDDARKRAKESFDADPTRQFYGVQIERYITEHPESALSAIEFSVKSLMGAEPDQIVYDTINREPEIMAAKGQFTGQEILIFKRDLSTDRPDRGHVEAVYKRTQNPWYNQEMDRRRDEERNYQNRNSELEKQKAAAEQAEKAAKDEKERRDEAEKKRRADEEQRKLQAEREKQRKEDEERYREAKRMTDLKSSILRRENSPDEQKEYDRLMEKAEKKASTGYPIYCGGDIDTPACANPPPPCTNCSTGISQFREASFLGNYKVLRDDQNNTERLKVYSFGQVDPVAELRARVGTIHLQATGDRFQSLVPYPQIPRR